MKRPVRIDPDNVADGVNRLLLALGPEDARVLELSAEGSPPSPTSSGG
jgi:hypothetical protein